jgi:hypothetical protein
MIESKRLADSGRKISDVALDGLFGGLAGGVAMAAYLAAWGLMTGVGPGADETVRPEFVGLWLKETPSVEPRV